MHLLKQIITFGAVGCCATFIHVGVAWSLISFSSSNPYLANLAGAILAFAVSFLGNAFLTFGVKGPLARYAVRYVFVSGCSLFLTSAELAAVERFGLAPSVYAIAVLLTVPPATFLFSKLWAFAIPPKQTSEAI